MENNDKLNELSVKEIEDAAGGGSAFALCTDAQAHCEDVFAAREVFLGAQAELKHEAYLRKANVPFFYASEGRDKKGLQKLKWRLGRLFGK